MNVLNIQMFEVILLQILNKILNLDLFDITLLICSITMLIIVLLGALCVIGMFLETFLINNNCENNADEDNQDK